VSTTAIFFTTTADNFNQTIAVMIDADNASHRESGGLMAEIANYGKASVRRIYCDWTNYRMNG
jgi:hypothetical protein